MGKRGVYTINIGGEDRTGRFTLGFWEKLEADYGEPVGYLMSFLTEIKAKEIISLFYCSLSYGAEVERKTFPHSRAEVAEWVEDLQDEEGGEEAIQGVVQTFLDSRQVGKIMEAAEKITEEINKAKAEAVSTNDIKKKQEN